LVGVACAQVAAIRALQFEFDGSTRRGVCVTDKVTAQDFDAHAALGYSEGIQTLTEKQKAAKRAQLHADLADTFGELLSLSDAFELTE
jgi:hypothetical protein